MFIERTQAFKTFVCALSCRRNTPHGRWTFGHHGTVDWRTNKVQWNHVFCVEYFMHQFNCVPSSCFQFMAISMYFLICICLALLCMCTACCWKLCYVTRMQTAKSSSTAVGHGWVTVPNNECAWNDKRERLGRRLNSFSCKSFCYFTLLLLLYYAKV